MLAVDKRCSDPSSEEKSAGSMGSTKEVKKMDYNQILASPLKVFSGSTPNSIRVRSNIYESCTSIGLRPAQEDRIVTVPKLFSDDIAVCACFDGTVGNQASEYMSQNFLSHLLDTQEMKELLTTVVNESRSNNREIDASLMIPIIRNALQKTFINADASLLSVCAENAWHYTSSTGVAAILWKNNLTIAHVGDSKASITRVNSRTGDITAEWLTVDHKPNTPSELSRIQEHGGSLVWLHGNKAYIRGGDFLPRQARNEHPKQLNYSRAFGGKDLKKYGLIAEPDVNHFELHPDDKLVLIASDGLWDVIDPTSASRIALQAFRQGKSATQALVNRAIQEMPIKNVCDNVSVIAIFINCAN